MNASLPDAATPTLRIEGLTKHFGGLRAVGNFDLTVRQGELAGLIGPNGAGKTTVFNMISGLYIPSAGDIRFQGDQQHRYGAVRGHAAGDRADLPEHPALSRTSAYSTTCVSPTTSTPATGWSDAILRTATFARRERELTEQAQDFLAIFKLERHPERAGLEPSLRRAAAGGDRARAGLQPAPAAAGRARRRDEPAPRSCTLMELIHFIRDRFNLTILLIEHQMRVVMGICEHITVMDFGEVIARGTPKEIQDEPQGHRGVPREGGRACCLRWRISTSTTAPSTRCRGSPSAWIRGRSSPSSGPTAPGSPRRCERSRGCCARGAGLCASAARTSP